MKESLMRTAWITVLSLAVIMGGLTIWKGYEFTDGLKLANVFIFAVIMGYTYFKNKK